MDVSSSLAKIKGVGQKSAEQFNQAGLVSIWDLMHFLPRAYEDYSKVIDIADVAPGKVTIKAKCETIATRTVRRGLRITTATLVDQTGKLQAVWFNQPYRQKQLEAGKEFYFSGVYEFQYNRYQLSSPSAELVSDMPVQTDRILPVYPAIKGLKSNLVRKVLSEIRLFMEMFPETLPEEIIRKQQLISHGEALVKLHFPKNEADIEAAKERLAFEELFQLLVASYQNKSENAKLLGWQLQFQARVVKEFVKKLPFELTSAQRRAAWEILQDFEKEFPMNRLLQGDVGAGKTVVAGIAARQAAHHGYQTAILAPTEVLAVQHAKTLDNLLAPFGVTVALLTASVKGKQRQALYSALADGEIDVIVGTHALIQPAVVYHKLGFVVIDEQHRFGVNQRQELLKKSKRMPHLLAMTATPIPRSLALTLYGEMDVSILNELPKNRKAIITKIWSPNSRNQLYEKIEHELASGRQAYVICSLIEGDPANELKSVQSEHQRLQQSVFKHRRIGLLHGKLSADQKNDVMDKFKNHEIDILVSTTVVEVGVDVPNATVMIIEDSDRFGLAQLHQLRGRVGRSEHQSYCYLVTSSSAKPSQRLREVEKSVDGFYLAEVDLTLRGPGEIYGRAQHGALNLQIATLSDTRMIARAQKAAKQFVDSGEPLVQYKQLAAQVQYYQRLTTLN